MRQISRKQIRKLLNKKLRTKKRNQKQNGGFLGFGNKKKCFDADAYKMVVDKYKEFSDAKSKNPPEYCKILDGIKLVKNEMEKYKYIETKAGPEVKSKLDALETEIKNKMGTGVACVSSSK